MENVGHRLLALKGEGVSLKRHVFSTDSCPPRTVLLAICVALALANDGFYTVCALIFGLFLGPSLSIVGELQKASVQDAALSETDGTYRLKGLVLWSVMSCCLCNCRDVFQSRIIIDVTSRSGECLRSE